MVGVGAEDVVGLARAVQELVCRVLAELGQRPCLMLKEPLVCLEALGTQQLLALEAPEVGQLPAARAGGLRVHDLLVQRQAPLQALEEHVVQDRHGACRLGLLADRTLQTWALYTCRAQRVQAREQLGALGLGLAVLAVQELELLLFGFLRVQRGGGKAQRSSSSLCPWHCPLARAGVEPDTRA